MGVDAFLAEVNKIEKLSYTEECRLFDSWKAGFQEDRKRIIEAHLPWVVCIARKYLRHSIPLCDLIQIGVLGLIAAVDSKTYDPRRRRLFQASYFQINSAIKEAVWCDSTVIHVPRPYKRGKLAEQNEPLKAKARGPFHSIDDGDCRLKDILGDCQTNVAEIADERAKLWRIVSQLPENETATIRGYYIDGRTFQQIGRELGVTTQTACKYHQRAIARLRLLCESQGVHCPLIG